MDNRPLGVFDSGLGGLSGFRHLAQLMPNEDILYLGDTGRVPYGTRSRETIIRYACEDAGFLVNRGVKAILVACNTVSSTAMDTLRSTFSVPFFDVVTAAVRTAAASTRNGCIGVIGTEATVRSGVYGRQIREIMPGANVWEKACPLLVPLVENGRTRPGDRVAEIVTEEYLAELRDRGVDTLILGCTHYRMLKDVISGCMKDTVLVDSGAVGAEDMAGALLDLGTAADRSRAGRHTFYVTDSTEGFEKQASIFLETDEHLAVSRVDLN